LFGFFTLDPMRSDLAQIVLVPLEHPIPFIVYAMYISAEVHACGQLRADELNEPAISNVTAGLGKAFSRYDQSGGNRCQL